MHDIMNRGGETFNVNFQILKFIAQRISLGDDERRWTTPAPIRNLRKSC